MPPFSLSLRGFRDTVAYGETRVGRTLNQLVEGSSPSRLTRNIRALRNQSRAKWRGSIFSERNFAFEAVRKNVER